MSGDQDKSQKTEEATEKKLLDARKKGQVAKSREPATALAFLLLASVFVSGSGLLFIEHAKELLRLFLSGQWQLGFTPQGMQTLLFEVCKEMAFMLLPIVIPVMLFGLASQLMVSGLAASSDSIKPKLERISLPKGLKRLFSMRTLVELFKSLFKIILIALACWLLIYAVLPRLLHSSDLSIEAIAALATQQSMSLLLICGFLFAVLALADVFYQRWEHSKEMRMSLKEIRDEMKESDGDPQQKAKQRQTQQERANQRMMSDVPKADVIVLNPTHIAVALSYADDGLSAPKVLAKGKGLIAAKIREIAQEHHLPMRENCLLARSLYKSVAIGDEIPEALYEAVAVILAEIFQLRQKAAYRAS